MTLEQRIRDLSGVYGLIHAMGYDHHRKQIMVMFLNNAPTPMIAQTVIFRRVHLQVDEWHGDDPHDDAFAEGLIGLDEHPKADGTEYTLVTDSRHLVFTTSIPPEIIVHG